MNHDNFSSTADISFVVAYGFIGVERCQQLDTEHVSIDCHK